MNEHKSNWGGRRENSGRHRTGKVTIWANVSSEFKKRIKEEAQKKNLRVGEFLEKEIKF